MEKRIQEALTSSTGVLRGKSIKRVDQITGGCIHQAWRLHLSNGEDLFAKIADINNFQMLEFETEGLNSLRKYADQTLIEVPKVLAVLKLDTKSILMLPWFNFQSGSEYNLGKGLATLHLNSLTKSPHSNCFGWETDGFIGYGPQPKGWSKSWGEYFVNFRLKPQLKLAKNWGLNIDNLDKLLNEISVFLNKHNPKPSLVHGDLWRGNASVLSNGKGILIDPASYWADREVDIAMSKLFGGFSEEFYKGYKSIWPLSQSSNERSEIYNLYHIINHANIFGGSYKNESISIIKNLKLLLIK